MKKHSLMAIAAVATMAMVSCTGKQKASETLIAGLSPEKFAAEVDG